MEAPAALQPWQWACTATGFIRREVNRRVVETLVADPQRLTRLSNAELVREAGSEGVELIMWLAMRGALTRGATLVHSHYHIPVSNTAAGVLVLENRSPQLVEA
jgi:protocatechuate 4,5-dioxygenase beta chain